MLSQPTTAPHLIPRTVDGTPRVARDARSGGLRTDSAPAARRLLRLFQRRGVGGPAPRGSVTLLVVIACLCTFVAILHVRRRHEVLRLGYELSRQSAAVRTLAEQGRRLELERATLTAPERIRGLATTLGMISVPPDQIRVVTTGGTP